jgi:hypothetical protein
MVFTRAARLGFGMRDDGRAPRRRRTAASGAAAIALFAFAMTVPAAGAAGVDPVAPGVPGHGRAWELVTPGEVVPAQIDGYFYPVVLSRSGDRVAYRTLGALPGTAFGAYVNSNIAERGPDGWTSTPVPYPDPKNVSAGNLLIVGGEGPVAFSPELTTWVWSTGSQPEDKETFFAPLALYSGTPGASYTQRAYMGEASRLFAASEDLQRLFFTGLEHLVPADADRVSGYGFYEVDGSTVHVVEVEDDGTLISDCGSSPLEVSSDGLQALFAANPGCGPYGHVYLRAGGHTTDISASQCTLPDCGPEASASYLGRSADGSTVFIASAQQLTNENTEGFQSVYRFDVDSGDLSLLYQRPPGSTVTEVGFRVRSSDDGSRAYFLARGQLQPGQGSEAGLNLYLVDGTGLHFVAADAQANTVVSADGRYAVFGSAAPLAPGDGDQSVDVYRYDADTGAFAQVSVGAGGNGNGTFDASFPPNGVNEGGRRIFFTTAEPLLPQDRNEAVDVYEWTEAGLGLLSGGTPENAAEFLSVTADGATALFRTTATLLRRDRDSGERDIYAARVGGGFPEPPEVDPGCAGSGCAEAPPPRSRGRSLPREGSRKRGIELAPVDAAARRQLAATGTTMLLAEVPDAGRLAAVGKARLGSQRHTVASGEARAKGAGPVRLRLKLTPAARKALARGERLRLRLELRLSSGGDPFQTAFSLRGGR